MPLIDKESLSYFLPHGPNYYMVDALTGYENNLVTSEFNITPGNFFLYNNYFPGYGLIENMAQTAALGIAWRMMGQATRVIAPRIAAVKKFSCSRLPQTGETLETRVQLLYEFGGMMQISGEIYSQEIKLADGILTLAGETV